MTDVNGTGRMYSAVMFHCPNGGQRHLQQLPNTSEWTGCLGKTFQPQASQCYHGHPVISHQQKTTTTMIKRFARLSLLTEMHPCIQILSVALTRTFCFELSTCITNTQESHTTYIHNSFSLSLCISAETILRMTV